MPDILPFRGLRYNTDRFGRDVSRLISPPYDVLDADDKARLLAGSDRNVAAVDLPHVPPKTAGPDEAYQRAARQLDQWRDDGTLVRDAAPALYVYHQTYAHAGRSYTRRMFFAQMRIEPFGAGTVFPHEKTFGGPKEDRFKLMRATSCQLSPIFGLYSDPDDAVASLFDVANREPTVSAELEGVGQRLWAFDEPAAAERARGAMADRRVYIADGHHRYETAMRYRDTLLQERGGLDDDHPARFVFTGFCAMEDPGCLVLPTHRVLGGFGEVRPSAVFAALQEGLATTTADPNVTEAEKLIASARGVDLGVYLAAGDRMYTATFTRRELLDRLEPERSAAWRRLDLAYVHRYLIDELVVGALGGRSPAIQYVKSAAKAVDLAREENGIALVCKACSMDDLRGVSEAGDLMPQKSTYFYPKLATGLVICPIVGSAGEEK